MTQFVELFALDEDVARLEAQLAQLAPNISHTFANAWGAQREPTATIPPQACAKAVELAWYLRQSDAERALQLSRLAQAQLSELQAAELHPSEQALAARIKLIEGESAWFQCQYELAQELAEQALAQFLAIDDTLGQADTHWLMGNIALDRGDSQRRQQQRNKVAELAGQAGEPVRQTIAYSTMAVEALMRNNHAELERLLPLFPALDATDAPGLNPCSRSWVADFHGMAASMRSDFGQAAVHWVHANENALRTGQIRSAIVSATNVGDAFNYLNEHLAALDWMQRGLALAQQRNWPTSIALCQTQTAETMRRLGRLEAAQDLLLNALNTFQLFNSSRNYVNALTYLADLRLNQRDWYGALARFQQLQESADNLPHTDIQIAARRGQAHALAQLGQTRQAFEFGLKSLEMARQAQDIYRQMDACAVLAEIYSGAADPTCLPAPENMQGSSPSMHYLLLAKQFAASIEGFTVSAQLLSDLAREYARHADFAMAWQLAEEAAAVREKTHNKEATQRAIAMQIQHQTTQARAESEKARAESEHHQTIAAIEAKRAAALQKNSEILERLSAIGQEITSQLDISVVFEALNRHVHGLLDVSSFLILLVSPDGQRLVHAFSRENGLALQGSGLTVDHPNADSARCYRERLEILRDYHPEDSSPNLIPGSLFTLTALYAPLAIGEQVLGVMSIQSLQAHAYGESERLIFRTLCAYGAIALDNAHAYRQLQQAQTHLVAQEKLAALGAMVAGVAHELNTPLGNCLMITSALQETATEFSRKMCGTSLQRSDLQEFMDDVQKAGSVLMRGLSSAADLVSSFKQVAVDRTTAQRRRFELQQTCHEIIATMMNQIKISHHKISLDVLPDIWLESYPGPLGQVITNLINNAMLHGFEGRDAGQMHLSARQIEADRVEIRFSDDGAGISEHNLKHIFDPFFTTKMGQGGTGLGLSISFNIVTSLLNGQISVESKPGQGTCFILDLPLLTPAVSLSNL